MEKTITLEEDEIVILLDDLGREINIYHGLDNKAVYFRLVKLYQKLEDVLK